MRGWLALAIVLALALPLAAQAALAGNINIQVSGLQGNYSRGQNITGNLQITHDVFIPTTSALRAYISNNLRSSLPLASYLHDASYYSYVTKRVQYNLTSSGTSYWYDYPVEFFQFRVSASGTCGNVSVCSATGVDMCNAQCNVSSGCAWATPSQKYPCYWSISMASPRESSVAGNGGLNFTYDALKEIRLPTYSNNGSVVWTVTGNTNPDVQLSMREACGGEEYPESSKNFAWQDGWFRRDILESELSQPTGNYWEGNIERFDNSSLDVNRNMFNPVSPGGIYKNDNYVQYASGVNVSWDGSTGYIRIYGSPSQDKYEIRYLAPNGPHVCAYTTVKQENSTDWTTTKTESAVDFTYKTPFSKVYTEQQLNSLVPPKNCPDYTLPKDCIKTVSSYRADQIYGPGVTFSYTYNSTNLTVYARASSADFADNYSLDGSGISLRSMQDLRAPASTGLFSLEFRIVDGGATLASRSLSMRTCADADADGYCGASEGGPDCNDTKPGVFPGANETCNGMDDDCDGTVDEGFSLMGKLLGTSCNNFNNNSCSGQWACTADGRNVTCFAPHNPGDLMEICDNGNDDDCDGRVDEETETVNGKVVIGCGCTVGASRQCGKDDGECKSGYRVCLSNNQWSDCKDSIEPADESCNRRDDNCDGIVDNIGGGGSIASTKCGCFGGAMPAEETCNGVDDNCDGAIDNGIDCCTNGQTRACGLGNGDCVPGEEVCVGNRWSGTCEGGIQPGNPRVDPNCMRVPDCIEGEMISTNCFCENNTYIEGFCCGGRHSDSACANQNFSMWMIVAGGAILGVILVWLFAMRFVSEN